MSRRKQITEQKESRLEGQAEAEEPKRKGHGHGNGNGEKKI